MIVHRLFLLVWLVELVLLPALVVLDLGFSRGLNSNYYARFFYIFIFVLAVFYHLATNKKIIFTTLSVAFGAVLVVGSSKGLVEGHINSAFLSHIFYVLMPIIMISYGWHFFAAYQESDRLRKQFKEVMIYAYCAGLVAVGIFMLAYLSGMSAYNAIGIWNFSFAGPFLAFQARGLVYFGISVIGVLLAAKRGIIVVFVLYILLMFFLLKAKSKLKFLLFIPLLLVVFVFFSSSLGYDITSRPQKTIELISEGDIDAASAGRWTEAASAIEHLSARADHLLFGAGFGAKFLPWPDKPGYDDYYSHYTHFGVISYIWIGGVIFPVIVYGSL